jgi:O-antigen/teichoic acid export membrane protein
MSDLAATFKDVLYYSPVKIAGIVLGFASMAVYSRLFTPSEYAKYVLFISTLNLLYLFVSNWIGQSALRFYSIEREEDNLDNYFNTLLLLILLINCISVIFVIILAKPLSYKLGLNYRLFLLLAVICPLGSFFNLFTQILRADYKVKLYSKLIITNRVGGFLFGLLLLLVAGLEVEKIIWGMIGVLLPLNIALFIKYIKHCKLKNLQLFFRFARKYIKFGLPLLLSSGSVWMFSSSDRFIIQHFRGGSEVGLYSLSYNLASASIHTIFSMIIVAATPRIFNVFDKKGICETQRLISSLTRVYFLICLPMAAGLSLVGYDLVRVVSGEEYIRGGSVFPYVSFSLFFWGLLQYIAQKNNLFRTTHIDTLILSASGLLNVGLNLYAVPLYGFIGAAVTTLVSYIFYFFVAWADANRKLPWIVPWGPIKRIVMASAIMGVSVSALGMLLDFPTIINLVVKICFGILIYVGVLILLKEIDIQEIFRFLGKRIRRDETI